ncbi:DUF2515 family protein [Bacillus spongiae]|uniref:DUF2515 family protein n=1 Tax=Bacillus spongiae TaxID=2683610 RepID=A0ABU8HDG1_9BACI
MFLSFIKEESATPLLSFISIQKLGKDIEQVKSPPTVKGKDEDLILQNIRRSVEKNNLNNITRTNAYLSFYKEYPEIHWSFLAHMVSRNAGYHMTDIQSVFFKSILKDNDIKSLFYFLEKANFEIFADAYPQLLLYQESKKRGLPLFHLLDVLNISPFMKVLWNEFWRTQDSRMLTVAMIINEQQLLQQRVLNHNNSFSSLQSMLFTFHDRLALTTILFPFYKKNKKKRSLTGAAVHHFEEVNQRITTGKKLYQLLFHSDIYAHAFSFAQQINHTGSREDYWPETYHAEIQNNRVHSPPLAAVWTDVKNTLACPEEWYDSRKKLLPLHSLPIISPRDLSSLHTKKIKWIKRLQKSILL